MEQTLHSWIYCIWLNDILVRYVEFNVKEKERFCFSKRVFFFSGRKVDYKTKSLPSILSVALASFFRKKFLIFSRKASTCRRIVSDLNCLRPVKNYSWIETLGCKKIKNKKKIHRWLDVHISGQETLTPNVCFWKSSPSDSGEVDLSYTFNSR